MLLYIGDLWENASYNGDSDLWENVFLTLVVGGKNAPHTGGHWVNAPYID